jgi:hypothetical protein
VKALLESFVSLAGDAVGGALRVSVKTNYGPEFEVAQVSLGGSGAQSPSSSTGGISGILGVKAAVIVRDAQGRVVANFGDPPPTDPVRVALALGAAVLVLVLIGRGLRR